MCRRIRRHHDARETGCQSGCHGLDQHEQSRAWRSFAAVERALGTCLGEGDGLRVDLRERARGTLPQQLAFGFRGVLSFWTAGEISDASLTRCALDMAETLMLRYVVDPATSHSHGW